MSKKSWIILFTIFIVAVFFILILKATKAPKSKEIKVGVILPLTGDLANFGKTVLNGIQLAVSDNIDVRVKLIIEDSRAEPANAVSSIIKLIDVDKVNIIIGSLTSSETLAMAPIAMKRKIILISPTASNPALSNAGPYFYRVWPSDNFDGMIAAQYCYEKLRFIKAGIVYINNDYGLGLKYIFEQTFKQLGGKVLFVDSYNEQETDFRTLLTKMNMFDLDVIYLPGHPRGIGTILKQAKEIGIKKSFFSNVAAEDKDFLTIAGNAASGLFFTAPTFNATSEKSEIINFVMKYKNRFNDTPDIHAVKGYEAAFVVLSALNDKKDSPNGIKEYINSGKEFSSISGNFRFDKNGDIVAPVSVKRYKNDGSIEIIEIFKP